jgi:MraZ protein
MYPGKLDEKGRLKLPADFVKYFNGLPEQLLFITSLDREIAQIYPMPVWRDNERLLDDEKEFAEEADTVAFNANDLGANADIDGQGRVTFPAKLREALELQGQELHLYAYRGHVEVLSDAVYQKRLGTSGPKAKESVNLMKRRGLK